MTEPAIRIHDLHKSYGSVQALRGVHLSVPEGPVGLLGPNGAGKTTLLKLLLGMLAPDQGKATIAGLNPDHAQERLGIRQRVGYMPESDCLIPGMSAVELVALLGRLTGMPRADAMTRAHEVLDYVQTGEERYRKNEEYSTGMKQRIKLAQALVHDPPILLLDEPTNGLDPGGRNDFLDLVSDLGRNQGKHVLLCTHLLPDVERTCDHVIVMHQGTVVRQDTMVNLTATSASVLRVETLQDPAAWTPLLEARGHLVQALPKHNLLITLPPGTDDADGLLDLANQSGMTITAIEPQRASLEEAFLEALDAQGVLTDEQELEAAGASPQAQASEESLGDPR